MIFSPPELDEAEIRALAEIEKTRASIKYALHTPARWFGMLRRSTFARAIRGSNSIEGYNVSVEDAIAAAEGEAPLNAHGQTWLAVKGYRDAMTYVLQLAKDPHFSYGNGLIKSLHFMMMQHELNKNPGMWRPGSIYVRNDQKGDVVYESPPSEQIPDLMEELAARLNAECNGFPALIRAAMAHLNLVMIHPFSDGNGRMSRCLQTLVLAREGILESEFCSIEEYLGKNTQEYYNVLGEVGQGSWHPRNDVRPWIRFCLTAHYRQAKTITRRIEETRRVWDELEILVNNEKLPDRCVLALFDAAFGYKVRNTSYRSVAEITETTASRDLKALVNLGLLLPDGAARARAYRASRILLDLRVRTAKPKTIEDPFAPIPQQVSLPGLTA